jgi:hypothetical protein
LHKFSLGKILSGKLQKKQKKESVIFFFFFPQDEKKRTIPIKLKGTAEGIDCSIFIKKSYNFI